jgi:exonuclease III
METRTEQSNNKKNNIIIVGNFNALNVTHMTTNVEEWIKLVTKRKRNGIKSGTKFILQIINDGKFIDTRNECSATTTTTNNSGSNKKKKKNAGVGVGVDVVMDETKLSIYGSRVAYMLTNFIAIR